MYFSKHTQSTLDYPIMNYRSFFFCFWSSVEKLGIKNNFSSTAVTVRYILLTPHIPPDHFLASF